MNKKILIGIIITIIIIAVMISFSMYKSNQIKNENKTSNTNDLELTNNKNNSTEMDENDTNTENKILIAYFSLPETTGDAKEDSTITVNGETLGNTQYVANLIQEYTGADIFRIEAVKEYNISDHQALIEDAKKEQEMDSRPEIKDTIDNFEEYDTIFIGYPIWWSDLPQILYTFLESYNFTGKNIYLFSTNGGSGLANTVSTIANKLDTANVNSNVFKLYRENMEEAPYQVETWLKEINRIENKEK